MVGELLLRRTMCCPRQFSLDALAGGRDNRPALPAVPAANAGANLIGEEVSAWKTNGW
jgi:hypothetical protein